MIDGNLLRNHAAERQTTDRNTVNPQCIKQRHHIGCKLGYSGLLRHHVG